MKTAIYLVLSVVMMSMSLQGTNGFIKKLNPKKLISKIPSGMPMKIAATAGSLLPMVGGPGAMAASVVSSCAQCCAGSKVKAMQMLSYSCHSLITSLACPCARKQAKQQQEGAASPSPAPASTQTNNGASQVDYATRTQPQVPKPQSDYQSVPHTQPQIPKPQSDYQTVLQTQPQVTLPQSGYQTGGLPSGAQLPLPLPQPSLSQVTA